ncbi:hypothetical protein KC678_03310 [Candidatus Dojkabacteria bacterium]|uniref:Uncharacterized protein n=1 Tax=Candidatus Dojkabacteria bacterium TaxID=2099670 RepID=A0A955RGA0_9BACT|nr:hypothetical protein [Candidatus Dojkabacteria bacterium]
MQDDKMTDDTNMPEEEEGTMSGSAMPAEGDSMSGSDMSSAMPEDGASEEEEEEEEMDEDDMSEDSDDSMMSDSDEEEEEDGDDSDTAMTMGE